MMLLSLYLLGCVPVEGPKPGPDGTTTDSGTVDSSPPADTGTSITDSASTTDTGPPVDSGDSGVTTAPEDTAWDFPPGLAHLAVEARFTLKDGSVVYAEQGGVFVNGRGEALCELMGELENIGSVPSGCPACTWTFGAELLRMAYSGDRCEELALGDAFDSAIEASDTETQVTYYGYADSYAHGGHPLYDVVWALSPPYTVEWLPRWFNTSPGIPGTVRWEGDTLITYTYTPYFYDY